MRDYDAIDWFWKIDNWHTEVYSYGSSLYVATCEDFFIYDDDFLCPYSYDVNLIFNI